jgi:hypothetical protein
MKKCGRVAGSINGLNLFMIFLDQNIIILTRDPKLEADESGGVGRICSLAYFVYYH